MLVVSNTIANGFKLYDFSKLASQIVTIKDVKKIRIRVRSIFEFETLWFWLDRMTNITLYFDFESWKRKRKEVVF